MIFFLCGKGERWPDPLMHPAAPRRIPLADGGSRLAVRCYRVPPFPERHQQLQALAGFLLMVGPADHPPSVAPESNPNSHHSHLEWADQLKIEP
jgi:hypothetical protein